MSLQSLAPDFAIGISHRNVPAEDEKAKQAAAKDESNLEKLFKTLEEFGFKFQVRAGADKETQLLVFVKINSKVYEELVKKDLLRNFEFGLTDDNSAPYNKQRLIYEYLTNQQSLGGVGITPGSGEWKFVTSITSLDGYLVDSKIPELAKKELLQPTFSTAETRTRYGPSVALFFNFVRFYTVALAGLSVFGIIGFLKSKNYSIAYSFINLIWGAVVLVLWRRRAKFLAYSWGVQNSLELERFCADIAGEKGVAHDSKQRADLDKARFVKQLAFLPVAAGLGFVLLMVQGLCFVLEIFISEIYDGPGKMFLTLTPTILLSTFVPVFTIIYNMVTEKFIAWESHNSHLTRSQSFAIKSFLLNIMTGYVPLLISAFIYLPFAHLLQPNLVYIKRAISGRIRADRYAYSYLTNIKSSDNFQINQSRLDSQYFYFIVTNQVIGSVLKFGLPLVITPILNFVMKIVKGKKAPVDVKEDPEEKAYLERVRRAAALPDHSVDDSFRDIALQFGYVAIFGSIWTLAPVICLLFNVLTFKMEQWRLASGLYFKPVVARRTDTIYPWDVAFFFLAWLGSIVSPLVASFYRHGAKPPKKFGSFGFDKASVNVGSTVGLVTVLLLSEHLFFVLYFVGGKLSDLFKSAPEIENDNFQNTLILKREQFSSEKLPEIATPDDSAWGSYDSSAALSQVKSLQFYEPTPEEIEKIDSSSRAVGSSTGVSTTPASEGDSSIENKKRILEQKRQELARLQKEKEEQLRARMNEGDSIINVKNSEGQTHSAIMDDNTHVPSTGVDFEKDIDAEASAARNKELLGDSEANGGVKLSDDAQASKSTGEKKTSAANSRKSTDNKSTASSSEDGKKSSRKKSLKNLLRKK